MYTLTITDTHRKWYYNGKLILTYYYDSGFNLDDCILCWYYLSHTNTVKGYTTFYGKGYINGSWKWHNYNISKLDINITDNILYTPCNVPMYKYDSMDDGNDTACARSYYDIYRFFMTHTGMHIITRDGKRMGCLEKCEKYINNIPYYEYVGIKNMENLGLRINKIYKSQYYDQFTRSYMNADGFALTFGVPR